MTITAKIERQPNTRGNFNRSIISTAFPAFGKRIVKLGVELNWPRESDHQSQRSVRWGVLGGPGEKR